MQEHQQRVVDEKIELDKKQQALEVFIDSSAVFKSLDAKEQERLVRQCDVMKEYSDILRERIKAF
jgi:hypothetical protein